MAEDAVLVESSGREVPITSPSKVFFAERGDTKLDLVRYYQAVEEPLLRAMGGRPVLLQRFPNGAGGPSFFQKRVPDARPDWLQTAIVSTPNGTTSRALVTADLAHVLWAVNLGCLGFHVWPAKAADPEHADELRIDLDPTPGVTFPMVQEAAREVRALLNEVGFVGLPKTTGNRGIHVYVRLQPRWTSIEVRSAAVAVARELERRRPDLITAAWWKEERGRRVFIDFNQNAPHKTIFGAWSVRARPGAQVSTPFEWEEVDDIVIDELTIATVPAAAHWCPPTAARPATRRPRDSRRRCGRRSTPRRHRYGSRRRTRSRRGTRRSARWRTIPAGRPARRGATR